MEMLRFLFRSEHGDHEIVVWVRRQDMATYFAKVSGTIQPPECGDLLCRRTETLQCSSYQEPRSMRK